MKKTNINKALSTEQKQFIINLSNEMKTQDNRATAQPYALILTEEVERLLPDDYGGDNTMILYHGDEVEKYIEENADDLHNLILSLLDDVEEIAEFKSITEFYNIVSWINEHAYNDNLSEINIVQYKKNQEVKLHSANFFITEKAYYEYLDCNRHNLNKPQSYGIHLYRNNEMKKLYEIIHALAEAFSDEQEN
jgi:hypothetical protein